MGSLDKIHYGYVDGIFDKIHYGYVDGIFDKIHYGCVDRIFDKIHYGYVDGIFDKIHYGYVDWIFNKIHYGYVDGIFDKIHYGYVDGIFDKIHYGYVQEITNTGVHAFYSHRLTMASTPTATSCSSNRLTLITSVLLTSLLLFGTLVFSGCGKNEDIIGQIEADRQARLQSQSKQDHLGQVHRMLTRLIELNPDEASRQITYHLNRWLEQNPLPEFDRSSSGKPAILKTVNEYITPDEIDRVLFNKRFIRSDVDHLRDAYLFRTILQWIDRPSSDDPLLADWLADQTETLGEANATRLRTATRLFDWTIRNIALEPAFASADGRISAPTFPLGMVFQGPGYRQTDFQTVWRGIGDGLQRAGVFTQLCNQAGIVSAVLSLQIADTGELRPWAVGVLIGEDVYLFEPNLGIFVPGPDQIGIATLAQARSDASVMRRLNIPGFFDYPLSKQDVQQNTAMLNITPVALSPRMKLLQSRLAGERRMNLFTDVDAASKQLDAAVGIAGVRLWPVPILADVYQEALAKAAERDPMLSVWRDSSWAILESEADSSKEFALARWRHLHGQFDNDESKDMKGARPLYLAQRAPEFEIEDLRIDVDLQKQYGVRRQLGVAPEVYDAQLQFAQQMMQFGKRTATYWVSLIQYDDARYDNAVTWLRKRVLDEGQLSHWVPSAQYNLGRSLEQLGDEEEAIELYKTSGNLQEHGNRIRARLLSRSP
ncbi:hypothetical protein Q31b_43680 [Novipirellula aureliae]|uniref:Uncharacterized protein n=1 Tax=Novipirellula aureliae TaxID=2527966 RepID=A0A5C6DL36_9BACT|nr:hypothetical protein [Novipirellula aureliae]TWU37580.1 hypothetical protein Q31b_43680 [Novipirellula aureliae]